MSVASCFQRTRIEKLEHLKAFECWLALGDERTYKKVAEKCHVSHQSVYNWAHSFNWEERLKARQAELAKKLAVDSDKQLLEYRRKNIKRLRETLELYDKKLAEGKVDVTSIPDILKVIELQEKLMDGLDHGLADDIPKKSEQMDAQTDGVITNATFSLTDQGENY